MSDSSWLLLLIRNSSNTRFPDVLVCNTAVLGEGKGSNSSARGEVEVGVCVGGRGLGTGLACEATTSCSVRGRVGGTLVDISEVDAGAEASVIE